MSDHRDELLKLGFPEAVAESADLAEKSGLFDLKPPSLEYKMWLVIRTDLPLSQGKMGAQVGHAFGRLYMEASKFRPGQFEAYLADNEPKITVKVSDEAKLLRVYLEAKAAGIPCQLIRDAGRSEIAANTPTVCAFGPSYRDDLPPYLRRLQVLRDE
jgi:PTH2 family peptidyl-tRNA hydrolase